MKSTTLYTTIFEELRDEIITGKYARDFPSETQLVERFAASRQTVIRAMSELVKAGLIERRRGSGTVVSRKMRQKLGQIGLVGVDNFRSGYSLGKYLVHCGATRIAVPSRVMVTGFDDLPASAQFVPALTTVRQVFSDLAEVAADVLFRRMADPNLPVVTISLPTKLIVRESTKRPE